MTDRSPDDSGPMPRGRRAPVDQDVDVPDEKLLGALADASARSLLAALDAPKTAAELREETELATSTVYRKLDRLAETGLVEQSTRVRRDGKHASEYERRFEDLVVHVSDETGFDVTVVEDGPAPVPGGAD